MFLCDLSKFLSKLTVDAEEMWVRILVNMKSNLVAEFDAGGFLEAMGVDEIPKFAC